MIDSSLRYYEPIDRRTTKTQEMLKLMGPLWCVARLCGRFVCALAGGSCYLPAPSRCQLREVRRRCQRFGPSPKPVSERGWMQARPAHHHKSAPLLNGVPGVASAPMMCTPQPGRNLSMRVAREKLIIQQHNTPIADTAQWSWQNLLKYLLNVAYK